MTNEKDRLTDFIMERDISSIQLLASNLLTDEDTVRNLLADLILEGKLDGYITEDGKRFFKNQVPVHHSKESKSDDLPEFMKYNTAPGRFLAFIGVMIMILAGILLSLFPRIIYYENLGVTLLFVGLAITLFGCYYIGRRKTPM